MPIAVLAVVVVADGEEGGGDVVYGLKGADDVACSGAEESGGEGDGVVGEAPGEAESGFAAGEEYVAEKGQAVAGEEQVAEAEVAVGELEAGFEGVVEAGVGVVAGEEVGEGGEEGFVVGDRGLLAASEATIGGML